MSEADAERRRRITDYRQTFGTEQGQRVLADLRQALKADMTTYVSQRPYDTAYMEGQRAAWLYINGWIEADPSAGQETAVMKAPKESGYDYGT